ncbi:MAG: efflux RND transporter periplasmic adaptor subunit [Pseudomonadota bacterium]
MLRLSPLLCAVALAAAGPSLAQMPDGMPVDVAAPLVETVVDYDIFTGRFEAVKEVEIRARVSGYLDAVGFEDGAVVEAGDLLFTIDQRTFEAAVKGAEAQLAASKASRELAQIELDRATQLAERNVGTAQEVDRTSASLAEAAAQVQIAEAELRDAQLNLEFTEVRAPISGRLSDTRVDEGNLVIGGAGSTTLLTTIVSIERIRFVFTASEAEYLKYARLARVGTRPSSRVTETPVTVRLMDEPDFTHQGKMDFVDNVIDPNSGTITGRAMLQNDEGLLLPGLFGRLKLPASGPYEAVLIPDEAILSDQDRKIVMVVDAEGTVSARPVVPGPIHRGLRVIREGLAAEDRVVVNGVQRARPGGKVKPEAVELTLAEN